MVSSGEPPRCGEGIIEMAGQVGASNFTGAFAALNGSKDITATRADIIRSLLTVGYPSRKKALRKVGPWRVRMLSAMAYGYLDRALTTTQYFRNLEQTEKVGVSFLLGEAFTHWFAQDRMGVEFLVHRRRTKFDCLGRIVRCGHAEDRGVTPVAEEPTRFHRRQEGREARFRKQRQNPQASTKCD
jgi:hypothetical protein